MVILQWAILKLHDSRYMAYMRISNGIFNMEKNEIQYMPDGIWDM